MSSPNNTNNPPPDVAPPYIAQDPNGLYYIVTDPDHPVLLACSKCNVSRPLKPTSFYQGHQKIQCKGKGPTNIASLEGYKYIGFKDIVGWKNGGCATAHSLSDEPNPDRLSSDPTTAIRSSNNPGAPDEDQSNSTVNTSSTSTHTDEEEAKSNVLPEINPDIVDRHMTIAQLVKYIGLPCGCQRTGDYKAWKKDQWILQALNHRREKGVQFPFESDSQM